MRALLVARKFLIEIGREPQLLLLELATPLVFLIIAAATYNAPLLVTHPILVSSPDPAYEPLVETLETQRYADDRPVFAITRTTDSETAEAKLQERTVTALMSVKSERRAREKPSVEITLKGDALYPRFYRASTILVGTVNAYMDTATGRPEVVQIVTQPLARAGPTTEFDLYAPGMMIVGLLMLIPQTAMLIGREIRWKTLHRLHLTPLRAREFLTGVSLSQLAVALVQVIVVFLAALALGFNNQGSLAEAIVVGIVISFSAIGQGLFVACFIENDSQAANVGSTLTMLQIFVSGAFFQLPPLTVFSLAGHQIDLFDVFPATHGFMALQQTLSYGAGMREVGFRLIATLFLSALYFAAGVAIFQWRQMQEI